MRNPKVMPWSPLIFWLMGAAAITVLSFISVMAVAIIAVSKSGEYAGWLLILSPIIGTVVAFALAGLSDVIPAIICIINLIMLPKIYPPISGSQKSLIIVMNIIWAVLGIVLMIGSGPFAIDTFKEWTTFLH